jgi:formate dehydrogenase iron-sulfur subunit
VPVELPLLEQPARHSFSLRVASPITDAPALMPERSPKPGEQFRFHFDMSKCIGCKCCVVACNEQNGNPAELNWRRVGEIEGGVYPNAQRWHVSTGCNHCLEPSCLIGCPVEAYSKDPLTGIVDHDPDICIGCQYCTWNCSYGVPQYNPERGVVGKCDMCHGRLSQGLTPACANACPEEAIAIEIVDVAAWLRHRPDADAPGLPWSGDSLSTTRVTLPAGMPVGADRVDLERIRRQDVHWSLVFLLVLSQLAVGAMGVLWLLGFTGAIVGPWAAMLPLAVASVALAVAPMHLGRPIHAWRALKNWRRSWLSREVLLLSLFAGGTASFGPAGLFNLHVGPWLGGLAVLCGVLAVMASARIYMVPARPSWNLSFTFAEFYLTCVVQGPRMILAAGVSRNGWLIAIAIAASLTQVGVQVFKCAVMARSQTGELRASFKLLRRDLRNVLIACLACTVVSIASAPKLPIVSFMVASGGEILGRYLFFAAVVPKSVASTFLTPKEAAA